MSPTIMEMLYFKPTFVSFSPNFGGRDYHVIKNALYRSLIVIFMKNLYEKK